MWTHGLIAELPSGAKNWGTARKALNVFLIEVFFNKVTSEEYGMQRFADVLETPLDSQANTKLRRFARDNRIRLPRWPGINGLTPVISEEYQVVATEMARRCGLLQGVHQPLRDRHGSSVWPQ